MHAKRVIYQIWVSIMICMCRVNTLLLVDVFQSFSNISTEIYELDPACLSLKETKPDLTIIDRCWYDTNGRERNKIWKVSCYYEKANNQYQGLTFKICAMKDFVKKKLCVLVSHERPQCLDLTNKIFWNCVCCKFLKKQFLL